MRTRALAPCLLVLFGASIGLAGPPKKTPSHPKLSSDLADTLATAAGTEMIRVIVQSDRLDRTPLKKRLKGEGSDLGRDLDLVGGFVATLPASDIARLVDDADVSRISPDRPIAPAMDVAAQAAAAGWSRHPDPPAGGPTGRGVVVAVIDSGIYPHEDLGGGTLRASIDFLDPPRHGNTQTEDPYGHGTHIAGIIAGAPVPSPLDEGHYFGGLAPDAGLISLRVLNHKGLGNASDVIAALEWCIEHRDEHGIRVVNLSLGQPVLEPAESDPLAQAVERTWEAGLVVVVSTGNRGLAGSGYGTVLSPGNDPLIITVGALDDRGTPDIRDDAVAEFSSKGPTRFDLVLKPDLVAPGAAIVSLRVPHSTLDRLLPEARVAGNRIGRSPALEPRYFQMSGSSMASAIVAGAVALMLEEDPSLRPDDVKARLMRYANHDLGADIFTRGAGGIDVSSALGAVELAEASASPSLLEGDGPAIVLADTGSTWGDEEIWGLEAIYGPRDLWGEEIAETLAFLDDPCITGEGLTWQTLTGNGLTWQTLDGNGLTWQTLAGNGLTWQTMTGAGLTWQTITGTGLTWQTLTGGGLTWQTVSSGGVCP